MCRDVLLCDVYRRSVRFATDLIDSSNKGEQPLVSVIGASDGKKIIVQVKREQ